MNQEKTTNNSRQSGQRHQTPPASEFLHRCNKEMTDAQTGSDEVMH